jgi:hypothetical protein
MSQTLNVPWAGDELVPSVPSVPSVPAETSVALWLDADGEPCGVGRETEAALHHAVASLAEIEVRMTDLGYRTRLKDVQRGHGLTVSGEASAVLALVEHVGLVPPVWLRDAARGAP